ncbi:MAG: collagen-binding protein [Sphingobacteriales bacterium 50-39]|nr:MAG: collagen-binding protein [Sphingobacteriales bacterium 50-39]
MEKNNMAITLLVLLPLALSAQKRNLSVAGTIKDKSSGETLAGATIGFPDHPDLGIVSNSYGFYSITIPEGHYTMVVSFSGYAPDTVAFDLKQNLVLNRSLSAGNAQLQQVVVTGSKKINNILKTPPGLQRLTVNDIKDVPVLLGEKDILKTLQLLPGVKSAGDGSSGFYVRGGNSDQNLILLDEAPVYNATHLLGFFSVFNSDAIKDVSLYKGGMPANYGGRLASVEDIKMRDGNDQQLAGSGGIGLISSRLNLEGPIVRDKGSFMITGRRTYADLFTGLASDTNVKHSTLYFYDVNLKANYKLGDKDRVFLSGYFGKDALSFQHGRGVDWGNSTGTFRWNHIFSSRLFSNSSLIYSNYNYNTQFTANYNNVRVTSGITDYQWKEDINYYLNPRNKFDLGFDVIYHVTQPGQAVSDQTSKYNNITLEKKYAMENSVYASHEWSPTGKFKFTYGIRLTALSVLGPGNGKLVKTYWNPEPRLAATWQLDEESSVKLAYDRNVQNIHLLNNSTSTSPTNVYLPTSNVVQPEISDQFSAGYYRNFHGRTYEFSSEVYYKSMQNQLDYKNNANLIGNNNVEADLLFGKGRAYGWESYFHKRAGRLTGWISYTLSRTERQISGINNGSWYPATQDQTHNVSIVGVYKYNRKWTFSASWVYNTGNAVTWPSGKFPVDGAPVYYYASRNGYRLPAYHRLDLGATLQLKKTAKFQSDLNFSIYNAYGQSNPYTIQFQRDPNNPMLTQVQQTTLFKTVPSITYNFKF